MFVVEIYESAIRVHRPTLRRGVRTNKTKTNFRNNQTITEPPELKFQS